uniref:Putative secreted protein n=1 Tax=Ixodes ricinus TaxID=34613 RepID=A0A6B0UFY9_IXORI
MSRCLDVVCASLSLLSKSAEGDTNGSFSLFPDSERYHLVLCTSDFSKHDFMLPRSKAADFPSSVVTDRVRLAEHVFRTPGLRHALQAFHHASAACVRLRCTRR